MPQQIQPPPSRTTRQQPPATNYPSLDGLKLPRALTQAVTQSFQAAYAVRDQTTANSDAINHLNNYGTWQQRLATAATALPDGALWFHTDLYNAVYQVRLSKRTNQLEWFYATGVVWQPNAVQYTLGLNDIGFMIATGGHLQVWNGTAFEQLI